MKITAQELRIGNLVECCKETCTVTCISNEGLSLQSNENLYVFEIFDEVLGIRITNEWLIKSGFTFEDMADLGMYISLQINFECSINWHQDRIWIGDCRTHIQYVHQLQNLYFAITGEELQINI